MDPSYVLQLLGVLLSCHYNVQTLNYITSFQDLQQILLEVLEWKNVSTILLIVYAFSLLQMMSFCIFVVILDVLAHCKE